MGGRSARGREDLRTLEIWRRPHERVLTVYRTAEQLPASEHFGLLIPLRGSAAAICTRIAEGCGREGGQEFLQDLRKARASAFELDCLLLLAHDPSYLRDDVYAELAKEVVEVRTMISGLARKVSSFP